MPDDLYRANYGVGPSTNVYSSLGKAKTIGPYRPYGIDPESIMRAEISSPIRGMGVRGAGQVMPSARDVVELTKRLRANLSRVPTSMQNLLGSGENYFRFNPQQMNVMNRMYQEARPVVESMSGMFSPFIRTLGEMGKRW